MAPAKSVAQLLKELEQPKEKDCLAPFLIFEDLTQKGLSGVWNETSDKEKELFLEFVRLKEEEASRGKIEYAFFFWGRMWMRLLKKETPIGEEHE